MNLKQYYVNADRCTHCCRCLAVCPLGAIEQTATGVMQIHKRKCKRCGACKRFCKYQAIACRVRLQF
ncbi:4Fe-4S binding protein [Sporomusa aerivorans]|uniref:4Fe-4S binding protein n=1 Tax=Sporomusa aerivorans TaxID=204936 RepID=UPI003529E1D7